MIYPFIAAVIGAVSLVFEKKVFNKFKQLDQIAFAWWLFFCIVIVGLAVSPWLVTINPLAITPYFLWLLLALAFLAANYNMLFYFGLRYKNVTEIEPFLLFNPLIAILIAGLFYHDERSWQVYLAAIIAGALLAWSHIKRKHIVIGKPLLAILGYSLLFGFEAVIIRQLLIVYSPVALYLIRAIITTLFLWIVSKNNIPMIKIEQIPYFLVIATGAVIVNTLVYLSYQLQGISSTIFILMLSPILVYALSVFMLKEKLKWKNILTSIVILMLIIWIALIQ